MLSLEQVKQATGLSTEEIAELLVIYSQKYLDWLEVKDAESGIIKDLTVHRKAMSRTNDQP